MYSLLILDEFLVFQTQYVRLDFFPFLIALRLLDLAICNIARALFVFCLAWTTSAHVLQTERGAQGLARRAWPADSVRIRLSDCSIPPADAPSTGLSSRFTGRSELGGDLPAADAWSESVLKDGTRAVTLHSMGETIRAGPSSPVTEEEARALGFPGYDKPPRERVAPDADYSPLSKRGIQDKYFDGIAFARCLYTGLNSRPIVVKAKLDEEARSLSVFTPREWDVFRSSKHANRAPSGEILRGIRTTRYGDILGE